MRAKRQNNQLELAFVKECKGEALSGLVEGTEVCVARVGTERPAVFISLNPSNRHVRTRMRGGVGGVESRDSPLSRSGHGGVEEIRTVALIPGGSYDGGLFLRVTSFLASFRPLI